MAETTTQEKKTLYQGQLSITLTFDVDIVDRIHPQEGREQIAEEERKLLQALATSEQDALKQYLLDLLATNFSDQGDRVWKDILFNRCDVTPDAILTPVVEKLGLHLAADNTEEVGQLNVDNVDGCIIPMFAGTSIEMRAIE